MTDPDMRDDALWPIPIRHGQLGLSEETNKALADVVKYYSANHMARYDSGFKHNVPCNILNHVKDPVIDEYFAVLREQLELYLFEVAGITPGDITTPRFNMFGNHEMRGQWSVPHAHQGNQVVVTYYPEVVRNPDEPHPYAGSMLFHNPTSTQSGFWARKVKPFFPIKPETGTLIIFPGNAMHSTAPFFCEGSSKCALVTNVRFSGSLEGDDAIKAYCTESEIETYRENMKAQA